MPYHKCGSSQLNSRGNAGESGDIDFEWHGVARESAGVHSSPGEGIMSATKGELWGSLRSLPRVIV